jgi:hypothetical protein
LGEAAAAARISAMGMSGHGQREGILRADATFQIVRFA